MKHLSGKVNYLSILKESTQYKKAAEDTEATFGMNRSLKNHHF
jgi:hypothetical protein